MNCQACGYTANINGARFCSHCSRPLVEPSRPGTEIYVSQSAGHNVGEMTVAEIGSVQGRLDDAKSLGQQSLEAFQRLQFPRAQAIQQHLAGLEAS